MGVTGTILALIGWVFALGFALFALRAREKPPEAARTRKRHADDFVTRDELDEAIAEATKELTFEWNEWYEKFDKLHLRLSKRAKRSEKQEELHLVEDEEAAPPLSPLAYRRLGSV